MRWTQGSSSYFYTRGTSIHAKFTKMQSPDVTQWRHNRGRGRVYLVCGLDYRFLLCFISSKKEAPLLRLQLRVHLQKEHQAVMMSNSFRLCLALCKNLGGQRSEIPTFSSDDINVNFPSSESRMTQRLERYLIAAHLSSFQLCQVKDSYVLFQAALSLHVFLFFFNNSSQMKNVWFLSVLLLCTNCPTMQSTKR